MEHEIIKQVDDIGVPHEEYVMILKAFVVLKENYTTSEEEIKLHVAKK